MPLRLDDLVKAAGNGDKEAFGEIYNFFLSRIYRFVYYLVYDEAQAEDITQETFIKAWNAMPRFSLKKGTIQAYLFTIARNLVVDYQRKKKEISLESGKLPDLPGEENLEKRFIKKEETDLVKDALSKLDKEDKEILIMKYFEDFSYTQIGRIIGKKEGAIRVGVHRTLLKLRDYIKRKKI